MWWGAGISAAAILALAALIIGERSTLPPPGPSTLPAFSDRAPNARPDLGQLAPREAADQLFNQVMMADERGDRAEAQRLAPMAIAAYRQLPELDRDAHFHLGLISMATTDREGVARAIASMRQGAPEHLLALILEHDLATSAGDRDAAARSSAAFRSHYEAEIAIPRPEYQDHRNIIERFHADVAQ